MITRQLTASAGAGRPGAPFVTLAGRGRGAEAVTELGYYQSVFEGLGSWQFGIEYGSFRILIVEDRGYRK